MLGILETYLLQVTMESSSHGTDDCSQGASGILAFMEKISHLSYLKLFVLVFGISKQLSVTLQGVNTNANGCFAAVNVNIQGLTRHRCDEMFGTRFFNKSNTKLKTNAIHQYCLGNKTSKEVK